MSRTNAHILAIVFDIAAIIGLWAGYHFISQVVTGIAQSADTVEFNSKVGFFCFGIAFPIVHLVAIYEYFRPEVVKKRMALFNWSGLVLLIVLFVCAFFVSVGVRTYVGQSGYLHCKEADHQLTFSTGLVYTRNDDICSQLIEEKITSQRY